MQIRAFSVFNQKPQKKIIKISEVKNPKNIPKYSETKLWYFHTTVCKNGSTTQKIIHLMPTLCENNLLRVSWT